LTDETEQLGRLTGRRFDVIEARPTG